MAKTKWICPVCKVPLDIDYLFEDQYFSSILASLAKDPEATEVEIYKDATWKIIAPTKLKHNAEIIDLTDPNLVIIPLRTPKKEPVDTPATQTPTLSPNMALPVDLSTFSLLQPR